MAILFKPNVGETRLPVADGTASVLAQHAHSMPLLGHLEELRKRIILSVAGVLVGFLACWSYADRIFGLMHQPIIQALRRHGLGGGLASIFTPGNAITKMPFWPAQPRAVHIEERISSRWIAWLAFRPRTSVFVHGISMRRVRPFHHGILVAWPIRPASIKRGLWARRGSWTVTACWETVTRALVSRKRRKICRARARS